MVTAGGRASEGHEAADGLPSPPCRRCRCRRRCSPLVPPASLGLPEPLGGPLTPCGKPVDDAPGARYKFARVMDRHRPTQTHSPYSTPRTQSGQERHDEFVRELCKLLVPEAMCLTRLRVPTLFGTQLLDLHVQAGPYAIGFLYDGWTARSGFADLWWDAALIGSRAVHVVYRLRRCDIDAHPADIHYVVSRSDPRLFSDRGAINAARLATSWAQQRRLPQEELQICYPEFIDDLDCDPSGDPEDVFVEPVLSESRDYLRMARRTRDRLTYWYQYARDSGLRTVEEVMARFADEQLQASEQP